MSKNWNSIRGKKNELSENVTETCHFEEKKGTFFHE